MFWSATISKTAVDKFADHTALVFEGERYTYRQLDALANRFAAWADAQGVKRGDTVALLLPNRAEYIPAWVGPRQTRHRRGADQQQPDRRGARALPLHLRRQPRHHRHRKPRRGRDHPRRPGAAADVLGDRRRTSRRAAIATRSI